MLMIVPQYKKPFRKQRNTSIVAAAATRVPPPLSVRHQHDAGVSLFPRYRRFCAEAADSLDARRVRALRLASRTPVDTMQSLARARLD